MHTSILSPESTQKAYLLRKRLKGVEWNARLLWKSVGICLEVSFTDSFQKVRECVRSLCKTNQIELNEKFVDINICNVRHTSVQGIWCYLHAQKTHMFTCPLPKKKITEGSFMKFTYILGWSYRLSFQYLQAQAIFVDKLMENAPSKYWRLKYIFPGDTFQTCSVFLPNKKVNIRRHE